MTRRILKILPPWTLTIATAVIISYLTLIPRPVPADMPELFPGADKLVHALMFGALSGAIVIDYSRKKRARAKWRIAAYAVVIAVAAGGLIELLQSAMALGRSSETADFIADAAGALAGAFVGKKISRWLLKQP